MSDLTPFFFPELPTEDPRISGVRGKYVAGEVLQANCSAARSHPAATLDWYINDKKVRLLMAEVWSQGRVKVGEEINNW